MSNQQDKDEFNRKTARLPQPAKPFPKIPDAVKENPKYRAAWEEYEKQVQAWVDSGRGG